MRKIRVLQVVNSLGIGGTQIFIMNYFRCIDKDRFQIDFLIFEEELDFYEEVINSGSKVYTYQKKSSNKLLSYIQKIAFVYSTLKKNEYDIVHSNACSFKGIFTGIIPAKLARIQNIIAHSHSVGEPSDNIFDNLLRRILKLIMEKSATHYFACSKMAAESKYPKRIITENKFQVISNAIDLEKYEFSQSSREKIRQQYSLYNKFIIGNIGRLHYQKNQMFLIDILVELLKINSESHLLLVGGGELGEVLETYAEELGVSKSVSITGAVHDASAFYSAMDVFCFPSLYEGLGLVAIEAQANGLVCIASDTVPLETNVTELMHYFSLDESPRFWAEQILKYGTQKIRPKYISKIKDAGFDIRRETQKLMNIYKEMVKK